MQYYVPLLDHPINCLRPFSLVKHDWTTNYFNIPCISSKILSQHQKKNLNTRAIKQIKVARIHVSITITPSEPEAEEKREDGHKTVGVGGCLKAIRRGMDGLLVDGGRGVAGAEPDGRCWHKRVPEVPWGL